MALEMGKMNLRRKLLISTGRVKDRAANVTASEALRSSQRGALRSGKDDDLLLAGLRKSIDDKYGRLHPVPPHDPALLEFLEKECKMILEHKDGSFLDHLQFGHEYAAQHFPGCSPRVLLLHSIMGLGSNYFPMPKDKIPKLRCSPRVLLLHSIMGLGSNYFPMPKDKIPKLRSLITDFEFRHVQAFPSFVRLWCHGRLPANLLELSPQQLSCIRGITFRRVIDNAEVTLNARDLWVQLNYQLVHFADFFPAAFWAEAADDASLLIFRIYCDELTTVLSRAGKVLAHVAFEPEVCAKDVPESCQLHRRMQRWEKVSDKIGHNLDYKIHWDLASMDPSPGGLRTSPPAEQAAEGAAGNFPKSRL